MDEPNALTNVASIDRSYIPFANFEKWKGLIVDSERWDTNLRRIEQFKAKDPALLGKARDVAKRAAAVDTGALEGLYEVDSGFTLTVATQVGFWQNAFKAREERTRNLIEAQLTGYDQVIDLATKGAPMAEAWIRGLHATLCSAQKNYTVLTDQGEQQHALPLGEYKIHPNHVVTKDGKIHAYSPVLMAPSEMSRLVAELTSEDFSQAHPILQAAFAHYALVWIHPFADGNGRTARALASVYMYRSAWIPFMVLMDHKTDYLSSLRLADNGNLQAYADFAFRRAIDAFQLVAESLRAARYPSPTEGANQANRLHVTRGGYIHADIDQAGVSLLSAIHSKATEFSKSLVKNAVKLDVGWHSGQQQFPQPKETDQRRPADPNIRMLVLRFNSAAPAFAQVVATFSFSVPVDAAPDDELILDVAGSVTESSSFAISSLIPTHNTVTQLKLTMFLEAVYGAAFSEVEKKGRESLRKSGFA